MGEEGKNRLSHECSSSKRSEKYEQSENKVSYRWMEEEDDGKQWQIWRLSYIDMEEEDRTKKGVCGKGGGCADTGRGGVGKGGRREDRLA